MSTVEKVELENEVVLGETLRYGGELYELTRDEARTVFCGNVGEIFCHCAYPECQVERHGETFPVSRDKHGISIGCVDFNAEQVAQVKKWLGE